MLGGIDIPKPPPKILRRRRGENAAFAGPGRRRPLLQRQLVKYGVGLIVLLGLLVYGALHFSKDDAPRKRKPAASEHDAAAGARKAVADE